MVSWLTSVSGFTLINILCSQYWPQPCSAHLRNLHWQANPPKRQGHPKNRSFSINHTAIQFLGKDCYLVKHDTWNITQKMTISCISRAQNDWTTAPAKSVLFDCNKDSTDARRKQLDDVNLPQSGRWFCRYFSRTQIGHMWNFKEILCSVYRPWWVLECLFLGSTEKKQFGLFSHWFSRDTEQIRYKAFAIH